MSRRQLLVLVVAGLLALGGGGCATAAVSKVPDAAVIHAQLARQHLAAGRPLWALYSLREAVALAPGEPAYRRQLAGVLYDLGFADQAIAEMEQLLPLTGQQDFLLFELGTYRLAAGRIAAARQAFEAVVQLNPGFSLGYYYLAETLLRQGDYASAGRAAALAQRLGLPGFDMQRRLADLGIALPPQPWADDGGLIYLRRIRLTQAEQAHQLLQRLAQGERFEDLARAYGEAEEQRSGGYVGALVPSQLQPHLAARLQALRPFDSPQLIEQAGDWLLVQRIAPWQAPHRP
ncbi:tetratricopeptide repeat protein [Desulfuromonas thiophila]|uniref:tetratricopeptide repeat protein n=1 Tax=Desulfuromonas thiophila TaxID=57664 RepID=UPI0024A89ECB|nr:tetratricopeptide repeat protein [Desulfuromonas thiophila]